MARDYVLPPSLDLTVDDRVDRGQARPVGSPVGSTAGLSGLLAELRVAAPPGFRVGPRRSLDAEGHAPDVTVLDRPTRCR